jgi:hypothetical protein
MTLHRDIFWVGRQWAVTGYGLQACDQKQKGKFDIEASRLWEDDLIETMHAKEWLNAADFDKGLEIARKRYPEPPRDAAEPPRTAPLKEESKEEPPKQERPKQDLPKAIVLPAEPSPPIAPLSPAATAEEPKPQTPVRIDLQHTIAELKASLLAKRDPIEPAKPTLPTFHVRFTASAKFVRPWRVRMRQ